MSYQSIAFDFDVCLKGVKYMILLVITIASTESIVSGMLFFHPYGFLLSASAKYSPSFISFNKHWFSQAHLCKEKDLNN